MYDQLWNWAIYAVDTNLIQWSFNIYNKCDEIKDELIFDYECLGKLKSSLEINDDNGSMQELVIFMKIMTTEFVFL